MIEYMLGTGDVWFASLEDIAQHIVKCRKDGSYSPRVDRLPYYDRPVAPKRPARRNGQKRNR